MVQGGWTRATATEVLGRYPLSAFGGNPKEAFIAADSDFKVACPSLEIATMVASTAKKVLSHV